MTYDKTRLGKGFSKSVKTYSFLDGHLRGSQDKNCGLMRLYMKNLTTLTLFPGGTATCQTILFCALRSLLRHSAITPATIVREVRHGMSK